MKTLLTLLSSCLLVLACAAEEGLRDLKIGDPAPDFALIGIDDKTHRLADFNDGKLLLIAFTSNHCPTSHGAETRLLKLLEDTKDKLTFVAINPNHPEGLSVDELGFSKYDDSFEDMKRYAADRGFTFPYLYDGETQEVAKAYGCLATPHIFLFDAERKLRYKGRFDNSIYEDPATVKSPDTRLAVEALLAGQPVPVEITQPLGCSTKWRSKKTAVAKKMTAWDKAPVELATIDAAGVTKLRENGSGNFRLFNVWATWCAPCVAEFPDLITTSRRFDMRDFEFITFSADAEKDAGKAKAFLEKQGAGLTPSRLKSIQAAGRSTNHYRFQGDAMDELMKALDPEWPGGIPHTVFVDPDGKILWRHSGQVDPDKLLDAILGAMGTVYRP